MRKNPLRYLKRKLLQKHMMVILGITLLGIGIIYLFDDVFNGLVIDFIRLFSAEGVYTTFRNLYTIVLPATIIGTGFIVIYYLCKDLAGYMRILMEGMDDVMQKGRSKINFPSEMQKSEELILQITQEYQNYLAQAREDEEKKKDLVYLLAQDIKLPLSNILMHLEFLDKEKRISQDIRKDYIVKVLYQSMDLEDMINEFFDITRFNLQYAKWSPEHMLLDRMMEQVIDEYYPFMEEKQMQVKLDTLSQQKLYADNDKIARVMRDLLRNLVQLGKEKSQIQIRIRQEEDIYRVVMQAEAAHLSAHQITHIFHNYYRLKGVQGSEKQSHVLGLGIAKQIMDMQQGELRASSIGDVLTFYVTIPITTEHIKKEEQE